MRGSQPFKNLGPPAKQRTCSNAGCRILVYYFLCWSFLIPSPIKYQKMTIKIKHTYAIILILCFFIGYIQGTNEFTEIKPVEREKKIREAIPEKSIKHYTIRQTPQKLTFKDTVELSQYNILTLSQLMVMSPHVPWMMGYFIEQGRLFGGVTVKNPTNKRIYYMAAYELTIYILAIVIYFSFFVKVLKNLLNKTHVKNVEVLHLISAYIICNILIAVAAIIEDAPFTL